MLKPGFVPGINSKTKKIRFKQKLSVIKNVDELEKNQSKKIRKCAGMTVPEKRFTGTIALSSSRIHFYEGC